MLGQRQYKKLHIDIKKGNIDPGNYSEKEVWISLTCYKNMNIINFMQTLAVWHPNIILEVHSVPSERVGINWLHSLPQDI